MERIQYLSKDENFAVYDELMEWEFAVDGIKYWENKLEELHRDI